MIKEAYCSFEIAKLLEEKGFNVETEHKMWYVVKQFSTGCHWNSCTYKVGDITREYNSDCCISMPTLQMTMKWLREEHNIFINIDVIPYTTVTMEQRYYFYKIYRNRRVLNFPPQGEDVQFYSTPEEAVEAALKYCLQNLI